MHTLLTKPRDLDFETFIFKKYLELIQIILARKEMNTTLEEDLEKLKEENLTYTYRFGLVYRIEKKKILRS